MSVGESSCGSLKESDSTITECFDVGCGNVKQIEEPCVQPTKYWLRYVWIRYFAMGMSLTGLSLCWLKLAEVLNILK